MSFIDKPQIGNIYAAYANLSMRIRHDPFEENVEEGWLQKTSLPYSNCGSEPFSHAAVHLDCTCSRFVKLLIVGTRSLLICYFRMLTHKAACHTLSKVLFLINDSVDVGGSFHTGF